MEERTAFRTCPFCEATCGLEVTRATATRSSKVRGDADDVFSHGFLCPKGVALGGPARGPGPAAHAAGPRRRRRARPASWDEAFGVIAERLRADPRARTGATPSRVYIGNPAAHNLAALLYGRVLLKALGTRNVFSRQHGRPAAQGDRAGADVRRRRCRSPVPDLDRTMHLLVLGANPLASNGSLMTAPDMRGRLRALRARGGKLVVVDPRRSRTAEDGRRAPLHPARDRRAAAVRARARALRRGPACARSARGRSRRRRGGRASSRAPFTPEAVRRADGHRRRRRSAGWRASWPPPTRAAVYGRIGTTTQEFGTLASWLVDVLNVLTGNLDREGGAMFPLAAAGAAQRPATPGRGRGAQLGRWHSPRARAAGGARRAARSRRSPRRSRRRARARSAR